MIRVRRGGRTAVLLISAACVLGAQAHPALALDPVKPICAAAGLINGLARTACSAVQSGSPFLHAGKKLLTGQVAGAVNATLGGGAGGLVGGGAGALVGGGAGGLVGGGAGGLVGGGAGGLVGDGAGAVASATTELGLAAVVAATLGGAQFALHETAKVVSETTEPQLRSTWFSGLYWRVAGISAVLTLPFLLAAAIQALIHSDLALLIRAALGYLPLAMLAVGIAAPLTMLLLAASDQMSAIVSSAAGNASGQFLDKASDAIGGLTGLGSPFLAFLVGLLAIAGGVVLWVELLIREAAVYVVVLLLPLAFAALVWPARRVWALRTVEVLIALILSKFAIVAVLALGGAALSSSDSGSVTGMLAGVVLLVMGAFAPWALLRLLPLTELASSAAGSLRGSTHLATVALQRADGAAHQAEHWLARTAEMRREADDEERRTGGALPTAGSNGRPTADHQRTAAGSPAPASPDRAPDHAGDSPAPASPDRAPDPAGDERTPHDRRPREDREADGAEIPYLELGLPQPPEGGDL